MKLKRKEDRIVDGLKELFDQYGYRYYKMRKFEEYSLYMENKNFLSNEYIITFNHNGKLLALKPDVTLSIVKNAKARGLNAVAICDHDNFFNEDSDGFEIIKGCEFFEAVACTRWIMVQIPLMIALEKFVRAQKITVTDFVHRCSCTKIIPGCINVIPFSV